MTLDAQMKEFVDAYINVLEESAAGKSSAILKEIEEFKAKMLIAAEESGDFVSFAGSFMTSDLNKEYNALLMKITTSPAEGAEEDDQNNKESLSVLDFVEQYRSQYEEIKKDGFRKTAETVYEKILALPEITDDMLEAQLILEVEGWQRKIASAVQEDVLKAVLEIMDLADPAISAHSIAELKALHDANTAEEYIYLSELRRIEAEANRQKALISFDMLLDFSTSMIGYIKAKTAIWSNPHSKQIVSNSVAVMSFNRNKAKRVYRELEHMGLTEEVIKGSTLLQSYMLVATPVGGSLGKYKGCLLPPSTIESYFSLYHEEIDSEMSLFECIKHRHRLFYMAEPVRSFSDIEKEDCDGRIEAKIKGMNYYKMGSEERVDLPADLPNVEIE